MVSGTHTGNLYVWAGASLSKEIPDAHKSAKVNCIKKFNQDKSCFYSSGSDGTILKWDASFTKSVFIDLNKW